MTYLRYVVIHAGPRRWEVWTVSTLTGDRKDCTGLYDSGATARQICARLNARLDASPLNRRLA